ncbi:MAG TPA: two-component regulator propeller domain-containing protein [Blastocatellia bacterium]|nr:two-component regulator propeller domain-containing protein [Blastocatellia bacterium]
MKIRDKRACPNRRSSKRWLLVSITIAFLSVITARALPLAKPVSRYVHSVWRTDDGLPQNYVVGIIQTRDGYLWLATQEGIARFDGSKFTVFDKRNTEQIKDNNIQTLYEDRDGNLWFGTEGGGVVRYRHGEFFAYTRADGLSSDIVDAIYQDHEGNLWVGTLEGLSRYKDGVFTNYHTGDGLANNTVLAIYEDREGRLWVGTERGLTWFRDGRSRTYTTKDGLADDLVRSICEDHEGALWFGTRKGLSRMQGEKFTTYSTQQGMANNSVLAICEDSDQTLWVGTDGGGLCRREGARFTSYSKKDGLSDDSVAALFEDREGNLWIGTYGGGLNRLKDGRFTAYTAANGLSADMARAITEDREGDLWIGTRNGLNRFKQGRFSAYTTQQGLADNSVLSLCGGSGGVLWVGTRSGLNRFKDGRFTTYTTRNGLSDDTVLSIVEDRDNSLWVGTAAGLNRMKDGRFTAYRSKDGLSNDSILSLYQDHEGALWVGTDGGGLNRFKDGRFSAYTTQDGLTNNVVLSLYEDAEQTLWVGTAGGLNRFKDGRVTGYTIKDGLFDDTVYQILEDRRGNLWMSCNKGVFRVSKAELAEVAAGQRAAISSISYGTADGMESRECNGGFQPAGWKTRDGRLWFPTIKGVAVVDPESIKINELIPPVVIEQVIVDQKPVPTGVAARFLPGKSKFEFHFTGLSYLAPEKVQFKYKLEGFDKDWVDAGTRRDAAYTNIPPGHYTFRVLACNNDLVWNEQGAAFDFYLQPYFYQTVWFYALCAFAAALLGWAIYHIRVKQMRAQFAAVLAERSRLAREIHDTLTQCFVGISFQLEAVAGSLQRSPQVAEQHLQLAHKMVRNSLSEARRSVWEMRSQALASGDLAHVLSDTLQQMTAGTKIRGEVRVHGKVVRLPSRLEMNLLRVGQEAITNALKHARPGHLLVELSYEPRLMRLRVRDDGCGFDPAAPTPESGEAFGLVGMRERAEQVGGRLTINSAPGQGAEIEITVPVTEAANA